MLETIYKSMANNQANKRLLESMVIQAALAVAFDRKLVTIQRWIEKDDDRLTSDKAKEVFKKFENLVEGTK